MISPEDANTIIKALMETEPMQWVVQKMGADKAPKQDVPGQEKEPIPADPAAAAAAPAQEPAEPVPGAAPGEPPASLPKKQQMSEETSPQIDNPTGQESGAEHLKGDGDADKPNSGKERDPMPPAANEVEKKDKKAEYDLRHQERIETAQYAALREELDALKLENEQNKQNAMAADRVAKLNAYRLSGFDIDVEAETERCSLENMPTDREFNTALDLMTQYAGRIPVGITLHTPDRPIVEDRHKAKARAANRGVKEGEPEFVKDEDFLEEVAAYAYELQCDPTWTASSPSVYPKARQMAIEKRLAKINGAATVAKVG